MSIITSDSYLSQPTPATEPDPASTPMKAPITVHDDIVAVINELRDRVDALDGGAKAEVKPVEQELLMPEVFSEEIPAEEPVKVEEEKVEEVIPAKDEESKE